MSQVLIICGGTGGHLTPGIAIAEELTVRGHRCSLIVSRKKVDARLIQKYPSMEFIDAPGAPFSWSPLTLVKFAWVQFTAFVFALKLLSKKRPDLVVGFGGFLTAGIAIPAYLKGIPFALHEANRVVGRSNRFLSRFARKVFLPDGVIVDGLPQAKVSYSGLPLRKEFVAISKETARELLEIEPASKLLVVFGGSQGASSLNSWAEKNASAFAERGVSLYCLTGLNKALPEEISNKTADHGTVKSWFVPFSDNMPAVLSAGDVVISRAGAGSIGEIIRCQVPSILIPYPFARDDHQTANAEYVVEKNAARMLKDSQLEFLYDLVVELLFDESTNLKMRKRLRSLDCPQEAIKLVDALEAMMPGTVNQSIQNNFTARRT